MKKALSFREASLRELRVLETFFFRFENWVGKIYYRREDFYHPMTHRLWEYHIFSQEDVSLYFHKFYFRSFKAEKGVKFLPPTKLEKNRPQNGVSAVGWVKFSMAQKKIAKCQLGDKI